MKYKITGPKPEDLIIDLPTSKSVSHRAMILAALNKHESIIKNILDADDSDITRDALKTLGAEIIETDRNYKFLSPIGNSAGGKIYLGNSGSSMRFLLPLGTAANGEIEFYGTDRLHKRPAAEMLNALKAMGAQFDSNNNFLPVKFSPSKLKGGIVKFNKLPSSQVISGLMMAASQMENDLTLILPENTPSLPYINMTYNLINSFGLNTSWVGKEIFCENRSPNQGFNYSVEKDMSAASYWVAFSLITGIPVFLKNVFLPSLQGDEFIFKLAEMAGGQVIQQHDGIKLQGEITKSFKIDCGDTPDLVPAIAVIAMFAPDACEISNIEHLRFKECDRIHAIQKNIQALGGKTEYTNETLKIFPQKKYNGAEIDVFDDHRIAMCFAIAGTKIENVVIDNPDCVKKSYPAFWDDFSYREEF